MPELPEVETVRSDLAEKITGRPLQRPARSLSGLKIQSLERRGKYIVYCFNDCALMQHLRMTGKMLPASSEAIPDRLRKSKSPQIRAVFQFDRKSYLFYDTRRFGTLTLVQNPNAFFEKKGIAPDPITDPKAAEAHFVERLPKTARPLKAALLDQRILYGNGNIYSDEALHATRLHPCMSAHDIARENPQAV